MKTYAAVTMAGMAAVVLAASLGTSGCVVHDRGYGYYRGGYGYHGPSIYRRDVYYRDDHRGHGDRDDRWDHDRRDRDGRDRWDGRRH